MRNRISAGEGPSASTSCESVEKIGNLVLAQPRKGYRYGIDPFLLVHFLKPRAGERIVDLGTGCGIMALLLARHRPDLRVWGVEIQEELARLAAENALRNGLDGRCTILAGDVRGISDLLPPGRFDRVVSNPPFRSPGSGRVCPEPQRAVARQELALTFPDLAAAASALLRHGGSFDFLHLPERLPEIFIALKRSSLEPKELRLVQSFARSSPEIALLSARKGGRPGLKVHPPLILFAAKGIYSPEASGALCGPRREQEAISS